MRILRFIVLAIVASAGAVPALAADDILDAIEQGRKAYQAGDLAGAKQSLDLASQLIGQKNAEGFAALLPAPLPGWTAEKAETAAVGVAVFGASSASRRYTGPGGKDVEVRITGDSTLVMQFAQFLINPAIAGAMGKLVRVGDQRAMQTHDGSINMVIANKFLVTVQGSADAAAKLAYAQAVDVAKLSKM
ncbi:MAG TPA: hypothetical protein VG986_00495 [Pseudolabrys sp.]|nr:hypothetical protein [Pseudolabrys sp.]